MIITIRKLESTQHEYIAYTKSLCGKALTLFILRTPSGMESTFIIS